MGGMLFETNKNHHGENDSPDDGCVAEEVQFSSREFATAFAGLSEQARRRVKAYYQTKSQSKAALVLGVSASNFGKRLGEIAKQMGAKSIADIFPKGCIPKYQSKQKPLTGSDNAKATSADLLNLIKRQDYRCALSGQLLTTVDARLDHIIPVASGGTNDIDNLQWLSNEVNTAKGVMSQSDFVAMCRRVTHWQS